VCQINRLQRKSAYQASEAIKSLPKTIEETYETIFLEIPEDDRSTARTALQWIMGHWDLQSYLLHLEYPYGIPATFLSRAILKSHLANDVPMPRACHEHDFLKNVLGCLVEVTFSKGDSLDPLLCGHGFMLAHYTITEFLTSDQVKNGTAKYFAMSQDIYAQDILDAVLPDHSFSRAKLSSEKSSQADPGSYYHRFAREGANLWETILIQNQHLQERHYYFFIENLGTWFSTTSWKDDLWLFDLVYQTSNDTTALKCQYILALYTEWRYALAERLLQKMNLETALSTLLPIKIPNYLGHRSSRTLLGLICRFSIDNVVRKKATSFLLELCRQIMNPSQLLIHYLCAHYHYRCVDRCCDIARILEMGANSDYPESSVRPLQVAVQCCDYAAVRLLLSHGAIVNGTGKLHGYSPAHVETRWWRASPLHILRNEEYWFMAVDFDQKEKVRFLMIFSCGALRERHPSFTLQRPRSLI
jgi:hypothetical protein